MCNRMVTSEISPQFHEFTILLPNNITGDKLPSQSGVVLVYRIENSAHSELGHSVILALG